MSLSTLEDVVTASTTTTDQAKLATMLKSFMKRDIAEHLLASSLPNDVDPLTVLTPSNSLGFLYVLTARLEQQNTGEALLPAIVDFCQNFNAVALGYSPERVVVLAQRMMRQRNLRQLLEPLRYLTQRFSFEPDVLTAIHPLFVHACCVTRQYEVALPLLEQPIRNINKTIYSITYMDNLHYHYAGGFALIALKRWTEAEDHLEICVSAPMSGGIPSAFQMEAMKKLALVQLIRHGQLKNLPKYVNPNFAKVIKGGPYGALAKAFPAGPLELVVEKDEKHFKADLNFGLVLEVLRAAPRWNLRTLTKTYLTLSLAEIAKEIKVQNDAALRALVVDMINVGDITATLNGDTLTFVDETPEFPPEEIERILAETQRQARSLIQVDKEIGKSREFLSKALKERDAGVSSSVAAGWHDDGDAYSQWDDSGTISMFS